MADAAISQFCAKSLNSGFKVLINFIFLSLEPAFIFFSAVIASIIDPNSSNQLGYIILFCESFNSFFLMLLDALPEVRSHACVDDRIPWIHHYVNKTFFHPSTRIGRSPRCARDDYPPSVIASPFSGRGNLLLLIPFGSVKILCFWLSLREALKGRCGNLPLKKRDCFGRYRSLAMTDAPILSLRVLL